MFLTVISAISLAAWLYLLVLHGRFWLVRDQSVPVASAPPRRVAVVIPARDEAGSIGRAVGSLAAQQFPGEIRIFVVDDHSTDGTGELARGAGAEVIRALPLPQGWTGKMWAVSRGLDTALAARPDYVLLTDADIEHAPDNVAALVARAERDHLDLASFMVRLENGTFAERAAIPAFVYFFLKLYPPAWIAGPGPTAGAAGGCMLVRIAALEQIGGVSRIRDRIIDDCALAREIKRSGGRLWMGLTARTRSLRSYSGFGDIAGMIARTAFTQLEHSALLLVGTVAGMSLIYLAPPVTTLLGAPLGAVAWLLMASTYVPMLRFYRQSPLWAPFLPLIAGFYTWATILSAIRYWSGRGGSWKGRVQAPPAGRRA